MEQAPVLMIPLSAPEARALVVQINTRVNEVAALLLEMKEREGWKALGYTSWRECVNQEFSYSQGHLYRLLDTATVNREMNALLPGENFNLPERHIRVLKQFDPDLRPVIAQATLARASSQGRIPSSGDFARMGNTLQEIQLTGHVDTGDGSMSAFDVAVDLETYEAAQRRKEHITSSLDSGVATTLKLRLPYPPSANRYWRVYNGMTVVSEEARNYKAAVGLIANQFVDAPLSGPIKVDLRVYRPQRKGDLDNTIKILLDGLNKIVYHDDNQIIEIRARRFDDPYDPRAEVTIRELKQEGA